MNTTKPSKETQTISRKYTRRSEAQWRELITNFEQSDQTLETYCQYHKIAPSGFYTWRKRFENEAGGKTNAEALIDITPQLNAQSYSRPSESASWQVELELGHGCVLRIKTA